MSLEWARLRAVRHAAQVQARARADGRAQWIEWKIVPTASVTLWSPPPDPEAFPTGSIDASLPREPDAVPHSDLDVARRG